MLQTRPRGGDLVFQAASAWYEHAPSPRPSADLSPPSPQVSAVRVNVVQVHSCPTCRSLHDCVTMICDDRQLHFVWTTSRTCSKMMVGYLVLSRRCHGTTPGPPLCHLAAPQPPAIGLSPLPLLPPLLGELPPTERRAAMPSAHLAPAYVDQLRQSSSALGSRQCRWMRSSASAAAAGRAAAAASLWAQAAQAALAK